MVKIDVAFPTDSTMVPSSKRHHLNIVTDQVCLSLSQSLLENARNHIKGGQVINLDQTPITSVDQIPCASENDLLVVNVSVDTFMAGANKLFLHFARHKDGPLTP
jgi:hypothetical protein